MSLLRGLVLHEQGSAKDKDTGREAHPPLQVVRTQVHAQEPEAAR